MLVEQREIVIFLYHNSNCGKKASSKVNRARLAGVNAQGNHGEDLKEYYYYLDATPYHSYLKMLHKYPQSEYSLGAKRE